MYKAYITIEAETPEALKIVEAMKGAAAADTAADAAYTFPNRGAVLVYSNAPDPGTTLHIRSNTSEDLAAETWEAVKASGAAATYENSEGDIIDATAPALAAA